MLVLHCFVVAIRERRREKERDDLWKRLEHLNISGAGDDADRNSTGAVTSGAPSPLVGGGTGTINSTTESLNTLGNGAAVASPPSTATTVLSVSPAPTKV